MTADPHRTPHVPSNATTERCGAVDAALPPPTRPIAPSEATRLGRYPVTGALGAGGMGEVLAVFDAQLDREVAIKVVRDAHAAQATLERFVDEARLTGQLQHPGVVPVYELGWDGGLPYFTMKRVQGQTLGERMSPHAEGPLAPAALHTLLQILLRVADTLAYAHAKGVIHRDLKPANIMTGEFGEVYVMDWGLGKRVGRAWPEPHDHARHAADAGHDREADGRAGPPLTTRFAPTSEGTRDGVVVGTPAYMPPEQAEGRVATLDQRADVYALGAILYEILAGRPPYEGSTPWHVIAQAAEARPAPPSEVAPSRAIPRELEAVALRAMARDPSDRYPAIGNMRDDLERYLTGRMVSAARYSPMQALLHWAQRHRALVRAAAAMLVTALLVAAGFAQRERRRAAEHRAKVADARSHLASLGPIVAPEPRNESRAERDPGKELAPSIDELRRYADYLSALRQVSEAYAELLRLEPADDTVRASLYHVFLAMGSVSERAGDYSLAELVLGQAAALGIADVRATARLDHVRAAREARAQRHADAVARRLREARAGELEEALAYGRATSELASYRERATVDALLAVIREATARLRHVSRVALLPALGDTPGAEADVAAWLAWQRPTSIGGAGPVPLGELQRERISAALARVEAAERHLVAAGGRVRSWAAIIASAQDGELDAGGARDATSLRLACEVLGLLGESEGVVDVLAEYLWSEWNEERAVHAGRALAELSRRSSRASALLRELVGLDRASTAPPRWTVNGPWWRSVARDLVRVHAGDPPQNPHDMVEPTDADGYVLRGLARDATGDAAGALADYARALECDPRCASAHTNRGNTLKRTGQLSGALADFDRAIELAPREAGHYANRGNARSEVGDLAGALSDYDCAIELDPERSAAFNNRASARERAGNLAGAFADYDRALELDPRFAVAWLNRGTAHAKAGNAARAVADFTRAIEHDPRLAHAHGGRGEARIGLGDISGAITDLQAAIGLAPKVGVFHAALGRARASCGDRHGAIADYARAIELDPTDAESRGQRGAMRLAIGDTEGAIADFSGVIALDPTNARAYGSRGIARQHAGAREGARSDLAKAVELDPSAWPFRLQLGRVLSELGHPKDALSELERALATAPPAARREIESAIRAIEKR